MTEEEEFNFVYTELPQKEYPRVLKGIYGDYAKALLVFARENYKTEGDTWVHRILGVEEDETTILEEFNHYLRP